MKQYEAYTDSGIQWLGEIPSHWDITPLKFNLSLKGRIGWNGLKSDEFKEDSYAYLVTGQDFIGKDIDWSACYQIDRERYEEDPFIQLANGDLLVTKDGTIGKIARVRNLDKPACLNSGIFVVKQVTGIYNQDFLYWTLFSSQLSEFNSYMSTGSTIQHLYQNVFENMPLVVPPLAEQEVIAAYLDLKVGQIDAILSEKEAMVEQLQQYRKSLISETVTRGLNPDAPMKDSGIDWIGQIPEHWQVVKLKRVARIQTGNTPSTSIEKYWAEPSEDWFTPSDFDELNIRLNDSSRKLNKCAFEEMACRIFNPGTVLVVGIGATLGKVGVTLSTCSANQQINAVEFSEKVNSLYGAYYLASKTEIMKIQANSSTLPIFTQSAMSEFLFVYPPIEEQTQIVNHIEVSTNNINSTLAELKAEIEDLRAYKSSVITEAVTGKVDLRDWKPSEVTA